MQLWKSVCVSIFRIQFKDDNSFSVVLVNYNFFIRFYNLESRQKAKFDRLRAENGCKEFSTVINRISIEKIAKIKRFYFERRKGNNSFHMQ